MPASTTEELGLTATIGLLDMSTPEAPLRRVAWIDMFHFYAVQLCLVADKVSQLSKCPVAMLGAFFFAMNPCPLTNVGEVFQPDRALRVFGLQNQSLRNTVIHVALEAALFSRQAFQVALGRLCAPLLQALAVFSIAPLVWMSPSLSVRMLVRPRSAPSASSVCCSVGSGMSQVASR